MASLQICSPVEAASRKCELGLLPRREEHLIEKVVLEVGSSIRFWNTSMKVWGLPSRIRMTRIVFGEGGVKETRPKWVIAEGSG